MTAEAAADSWSAGHPGSQGARRQDEREMGLPTDTPKKTKNLYVENGKVVRWDE
jgi:hypothetical protein